MSPEWFEWLRKNMPPHMFEAFERDRIHGTKWRDDEISRIQSALAAETKRREEAEKMISLTAKVLGSPDTKTHCLHCWAEEIMKELGSAHDVVQTLYVDYARLREALSVCEDENQKYLKDKLNAEAALEKLRDMQIVETLPIIDAALAKPEGGAS